MPTNPFASFPVSGSWLDHASYSLGGIDYPLPYGTPLPAPASGTLRTSGGSGEFTAGWVGSAGRRSVLTLDTPLWRVTPAEPNPTEAEGPMVAVVFQHQSEFGTDGWHPEGNIVGISGASANGSDHGGDVHLHWHGLTADGRRVKVESFMGSQPTPQPNKRKKAQMLMCHVLKGGTDKVSPKYAIFAPGFFFEFEGQDAANAWIAQIGAGPSASVTAGTLALIKTAAIGK